MRYFIFASVGILLLLTGCQPTKPRHLTPASHHLSTDTLLLTANCPLPTAHCQLPTFFSSSTFEKTLFKASMDVREHHLTGLMFIKKIRDPGSGIRDLSTGTAYSSVDAGVKYRIVFSNEFGMTYFDLEIGSDSLHIHYCFEPLNKNALWKILETDFRLLLTTEEVSGHMKSYIQDETNYLACRQKQGNIVRWDLYTCEGDTLVEVRGKSNLADQAHIAFNGYQQGFPSRIIIFNPFIKLNLSLSLLSIN